MKHTVQRKGGNDLLWYYDFPQTEWCKSQQQVKQVMKTKPVYVVFSLISGWNALGQTTCTDVD